MFRLHGVGRQLLALTAILLVLPVIITMYMLHIIRNSELALIENQKARLSNALDELDRVLEEDFLTILARQGALEARRTEQLRVLNTELRGPITEVAQKFPGVDMGYYSLELDAVIDGTEDYQENFSRRRKSAFDEAIARRSTMVQTLGQGGGILEAYRPFYRNGELKGVIWAYEHLGRFYTKVNQVEKTAYVIIACGILMGMGGSFFLLRNFIRNVDQIKNGLQTLQYDLGRLLPQAPGELGEITRAVNRLALRLANANKYNEIMLATIDDGILVVDLDGSIVIANAAARRMLELPPNAQGRPFREVLPSGSPFAEALERTLREHQHYKDVQLRVENSRGALDVLLSTSPLVDHRQEVIGAVLCCRDISERLRLEEKIRRQERLAALGKLVAGVAHEIRNPLTSISCYIQLWQKNCQPSPRSLATMQQEVRRLDTLVNQLLYFARPAEARFVPYNLNALVDKVLNIFCDLHPNSVEVTRALAPDLPPAWIDPDQIERVLMNILYNAYQAMPDGGPLRVETGLAPDGQQLFVAVTDAGCGIPRENLEHLFDPFFTTRERGTGLGLAIAYEIIQAHGGNIEVDSAVGRGTTFRFYVPAKKGGEASAATGTCG